MSTTDTVAAEPASAEATSIPVQQSQPTQLPLQMPKQCHSPISNASTCPFLSAIKLLTLLFLTIPKAENL